MTVLNIRSRTTDDDAAYRDNINSDQSLIYVSPLPQWDSAAGGDGDLEVELTVGSRWGGFTTGRTPQLIEISETPIAIAPSDSVIVEVAQYIKMPANVFGILFPKSKLVQTSSLSPMTTKVDPTYVGLPLITMTNLSPQIQRLAPGQPLVSLICMPIDHTLSTRRQESVRLPAGGTYETRAALDRVKRRASAWGGWAGAVAGGVVGSIVAIAYDQIAK